MDLSQIMQLAQDPKIQQLLKGLLGGQNGQGGAGLSDLLGKLTGGGMEEQVKSWVDTGANEPVTGQQLQNALGGDSFTKAAEQAGLSPQQAADELAQALPQIIDQASPQGSLPGMPAGAFPGSAG